MTNLIRLSLMLLLSIAAAEARGSDFDVQAWIDEQVASNSVLAATVAHLKDGRVRHYAAGTLTPGSDTLPDADTQFQIGSITKAFTNLLLAEMVEQGKVGYDTTIGDILDDEIAFANPAVAEITLLQLATHTSGLPRLPVNLTSTDPADPYKGYDDKLLLAGVASSRSRQPLGNHYTYSNFGVGLLGYLLGVVHGGGYEAALAERIVEPLGLERTGFETADGSAAGFRNGRVVVDWTIESLAGAGALRSTANDLMRVALIMLGLDDSPLAHDLAADRAIESPATGFDVTRVWHVASSGAGKIYWHNGGTGGFWSFLGWRPDTAEAVAILVSGDPDPTPIGMQWLEAEPPDPDPVDIDETLFGQYELSPDFGVGVFEKGGMLFTQATGQTPFQLSPVGDDWYAIGLVDASIRFVRADGEVVAVELAQNGMLQRAEKTADAAEALARTEVAMPRDALTEYVGAYPARQPPVTFTIRLGDAGLEAQLTGQQFLPIYPKGEDVFFYKVVDAELHFERDDDGNVSALTLHQGPATIRAEKSD